MPLNSQDVRSKELSEQLEQLVKEGKDVNWKMVAGITLGAALFLIGVYALLETVEPNPSPVYEPYVPPTSAGSAAVKPTS